MQATQVSAPFHRPGWVYEEKVDGYRAVAIKTAGESLRLLGRTGVDYAKRFPELAQSLAALPAETFTLDGEVAVYDQARISRFEWLRGRPKDVPASAPVYVAFDLLEVGGKDVRGEPLWKRRKLLEALIAGQRMIWPVRRLSSNGLRAWAQAVHRGYEGIVAKDPESPYEPGRTSRWLKVKQPDYRKDARGVYRE